MARVAAIPALRSPPRAGTPDLSAPTAAPARQPSGPGKCPPVQPVLHQPEWLRACGLCHPLPRAPLSALSPSMTADFWEGTGVRFWLSRPGGAPSPPEALRWGSPVLFTRRPGRRDPASGGGSEPSAACTARSGCGRRGEERALGCVAPLSAEATSAWADTHNGGPFSQPPPPRAQTTAPRIMLSHSISTIIPLKWRPIYL